MKIYLWQNVLAIDQLTNTLLGGFADETLSSRAYRAELNGTWWGRWTRPMIDGLFFWQERHCAAAFRSEMSRKHFPEALKNNVLIPRDPSSA